MSINKESKKIIEIDHITFGYTSKSINLDDISFDIYENEYICVIGHNGSGKSTLSKVLIGLLQPRNGNIRLYGETITKYNVKFLHDNIGIVFQNPDNQFVGLTVEDDIAFGLENRRVDPKKMKPMIDQVASIVKINDLLKMEPAKLSGGQKQRVAIASALVTNPSIIIFDESTSMLDPTAKNELKNLMLVLKNQFHKTIISITHDMEEVINADRVVVLKDAKLLKYDTPQEIFKDRNFLKTSSLDVPFSLQLAHSLSNYKYELAPSIHIEDLIQEICKIK